MNSYVQGETVVLNVLYTDGNAIPYDPAGVVVEVLEPGETVPTVYTYGTDPEVVNTAVGRYELEIVCDTVGLWYYHWRSTGDGKTAQQDVFLITAKNTAEQAVDFSYDPALLDDISFVRFNIADTEADGFFISDATIRYFVKNSSVETAIVRCLQNIVAQLSQPDFKLDWLSVSNKEARAGYERLLKQKSIEFGISLSGIVAQASVSTPARGDAYSNYDESDLSLP